MEAPQAGRGLAPVLELSPQAFSRWAVDPDLLLMDPLASLLSALRSADPEAARQEYSVSAASCFCFRQPGSRPQAPGWAS